MNENGTRKGERTKKPPKYMQYDDAEYGNFGPPKTVDHKQKVNNSAQMNQIAKLFHKFLTNANQKFRDYRQGEIQDKSSNQNENGFQQQLKKENVGQNDDQKGIRPLGVQNGLTKRMRDINDRSAQVKIGKGQVKKTNANSRSQLNINSNIQADFDYHNMINEHIRNAYPNISSFSPDMIKSLNIPRQLFENPSNNSKGKVKDQRGKSNQSAKSNRVSKESKEELKPFKRQSYHVAIAYHIHVKKHKTHPLQIQMDPTSAAKKLRERQN